MKGGCPIQDPPDTEAGDLIPKPREERAHSRPHQSEFIKTREVGLGHLDPQPQEPLGVIEETKCRELRDQGIVDATGMKVRTFEGTVGDRRQLLRPADDD